MIIQNLTTVYPTSYLKEDNLVLDISTRLPLKELYKKIEAGEDISNLAVFNAFIRPDVEQPFVCHRPPFEEDSFANLKVTVTEFEGFYYGKEEYKNHFQSIPVYLEDEELDVPHISRQDVLNYLAAGLDILPELQDKKSLTLDQKIRLSETAKLFYKSTSSISPYNPLPSYEDLTFYESLSSYEQRLLRDPHRDIAVSPTSLDLARYCKDEKENGFGTLFVQEEMFDRNFETHSSQEKVGAVADFDRVLLYKLGCNATKLPNKIFRSISAILADNGQLSMDSTGIIRFRNLLANCWVPAEKQDLSSAFRQHDLELAKRMIQTALRSAGCLLPIDRLEPYLAGADALTPAALQELTNLYLEDASERFLEQGGSTTEDLTAFVDTELSACYPIRKEVSELQLEQAFIEKFRRAPQITHDILRAYQIQNADTLTSELSEAEIATIVNSFNQKNIAKIKPYHSHKLLNMSRNMDFTAMKQAHLQIFATKDLDVDRLEQRGFFDWYNAHKDTNASELYDLLGCDVEEYSLDKTAKELTKRSRLKSAYEEVEFLREHYHIDFENNDVAIPGRDIVVRDGRWTIELCDKDDPRQLTSGYDTHCCQHLGNPKIESYHGPIGKTCVLDIVTNPLSANLIITDNQTGQIVAQSYVWSDMTKNALVLDNMEFEPSHDATARKFFPLIAKWCEQMPHQHIHIGTGYNQSFKGIGVPVTSYSGCHRTALGVVVPGSTQYSWYSDYHTSGNNVARALKQDGMVTLPISDMAVVSRKEFKTSALEEACGADDFELLGFPGISTPEDIRTFNEKASLCEDEEWVRRQISYITQNKCFSLLKKFTTISESLQETLFNTEPSTVLYLQNPTDSVLRKYLTLNPSAISKFPNLNPDIVKHLYAQNGLLIRKAPTNDPVCQRAAVKNEPLAIIYLKDSEIFNELLLTAIQKQPEVIKFFPNVDDSFWNKAIYRDPFLIKYRPRPTKWQKETAIKKNPAVVYSIKNAKPEDFALAKNLLRNFHQTDNAQNYSGMSR